MENISYVTIFNSPPTSRNTIEAFGNIIASQGIDLTWYLITQQYSNFARIIEPASYI